MVRRNYNELTKTSLRKIFQNRVTQIIAGDEIILYHSKYVTLLILILLLKKIFNFLNKYKSMHTKIKFENSEL